MLQTVLEGVHDSAHEIEVVFFEDGQWPTELRDMGLPVQVIPAGRLREVHRFVATVGRLARLLRRRRPDLILNWSAKTQLYGSTAAALTGMTDRIVWWQQGIPESDWLDRLATRLPAVAIGCYSGAAAVAQGRLSQKRPTFVVAAGSAVPNSGYAHSSPRPRRDVPVVGVVGRLQPWKGQDRILGAQALLRERGHNVHLLIVGGDAYGLSSEYADSLAPLVRRLGLSDHVTMTGQVPDAGPYIEEMDIIVNASDPEPFGIVLLEGMARGVAVVAVDSGGPAEFIVDGQTGMLARSGEPADLADTLERLLVAPELRDRIARAGREHFLREFTDVAMRKRFFDHLEALMREKPSTVAAGG
jgi:glycosyltransferase involved in cell wall biosynthesis